jgi:hypothetical protein
MTKKIQFTSEGFEKLKKELEELSGTKKQNAAY